MKLLIISQRYYPESFRITSIAEELVKRGHDVTVLTGLPNYPKGYIYPEYKNKKNRHQNIDGVKIIRAKEIGRRKGIFFRFLNYWSFSFFASRLIKKMDGDYDVVIANELSPIMSCKPAIAYKKIFGTKIMMYEMDLWPHSLTAGGIKQNSFIYRHYEKVSSRIYSHFDSIFVSTMEHIEAIKRLKNCQNLMIKYLPQYAEDIFCKNGFSFVAPYHFSFAGNIGKVQSINTILESANLLRNDDVVFDIFGDGSELQNVKNLAEQMKLNNIVFHGSIPLNQMPDYYRQSFAMIVTLNNLPFCQMTLPGKVQSYMASGKPIISCASGATNRVIKEADCGLTSESCDFVGLANNIKAMINHIDLYSYYSENAHSYSLKYFSKEKFIDCIESECLLLKKRER